MCLDHHSQCHARSYMTKSLKAEEVKEYRKRLHRAMEACGIPDDDESPLPIIEFRPSFSTTTGDKSTVINAAGDVTYKVRAGRKAPPVSPPPDAIGSSIEMRSYVEYLVGRYIDWRKNGIERGIDRRSFFPGKMYQLIKSEFGARANLVPQSRFPELVAFAQRAIDNTIWGKNSRSRNYHSFDEHRAKVKAKPRGPSEVLED